MSENGLRAAFDHCQEITRREAKNFYYGFLLLPPEQRRAIYSVYAFARGADDIADDGLEPSQASSRLAAYRRSLEECLDGRPGSLVFEALARTVARYHVPPQYLFDLVTGVEADLARTRYETFDELKEYCYHVASVVGLVCIHIFGYDGSENARRHAADLGIALQLTNILRDLAEDGERGRIYLPLEEMDWFGYSQEELLAHRVTPGFRRLIAFQVDRARHYYAEGRNLLPRLPHRARACVGAMAGIYSSILGDIERGPGAVFQRRISLGAGQKLALAGRELVRSVIA